MPEKPKNKNKNVTKKWKDLYIKIDTKLLFC